MDTTELQEQAERELAELFAEEDAEAIAELEAGLDAVSADRTTTPVDEAPRLEAEIDALAGSPNWGVVRHKQAVELAKRIVRHNVEILRASGVAPSKMNAELQKTLEQTRQQIREENRQRAAERDARRRYHERTVDPVALEAERARKRDAYRAMIRDTERREVGRYERIEATSREEHERIMRERNAAVVRNRRAAETETERLARKDQDADAKWEKRRIEEGWSSDQIKAALIVRIEARNAKRAEAEKVEAEHEEMKKGPTFGMF